MKVTLEIESINSLVPYPIDNGEDAVIMVVCEITPKSWEYIKETVLDSMKEADFIKVLNERGYTISKKLEELL